MNLPRSHTSKGVVGSEKLPVVWMHTPYNRRSYRGGGDLSRLRAAAGRARISRRRGGLSRRLRVVRPEPRVHRGKWLDAARMDAYNVTEWFAKQSWSNGRIGVWGCSATGGSQMQAASAPTSPDAKTSVTVFGAPAMPSSVTLPIIPSGSGTVQQKSMR